MHKISALFLSLLLLCLTGCEKKKPDKIALPMENTTEFAYDKTASLEIINIERIPQVVSGTNTFMLLNTKSKLHKITLVGKEAIFHQNKKEIVFINLFSTRCAPCIGQISYFNGLQRKYSHLLLILAVLTHDSIDTSSLKSFIARHKINYFISNSPHNNAFGSKLADILHLPKNYSIPLTIMYVEGKYFTHYEGIVPIEMIEYDIQQAKKQIKSNKE